MVTWSEDINLDRICNGINKYISKFQMKEYYIYGLQQTDRPHVRISPNCPKLLQELFKKSGYTLEVRESNDRHCDDCDALHSPGDCHCDGECSFCKPGVIAIGLRRDVRSDAATCRKLIKTIVFALEEKLVVDPNSKLNLGRRVSREVTVEKKEEEKVLGFIDRLLPWAPIFNVEEKS